MDKREAAGVLALELEGYRAMSYGELVGLIGDPAIYERSGASGLEYQVEVQVFWDDRPKGNVRVIASVDDGGWSAFFPLTEDFIKSPDGKLVGERPDQP
jgi:hypothetical protein